MAAQKEKSTILYERLSREDLLRGESDSNSIINQKAILENYAKANGFKNIRHICDDGVSGTRFTRPGLDVLVEEVKAGNVTTVIIKDSSRLGRDVVEVGLLKRLLEDNDVRLIAAEDGLDSAKGFDIMSIFRDVFNEYYVADCSKKLRAAYDLKAKSGKHHCTIPYGYKADKDDKYKWVINEEQAAVVRRIFEMCLNGMGPMEISNLLTEERVPKPSSYRSGSGDRPLWRSDPCGWSSSTVSFILENTIYIGMLTTHKETTVSYKNHTRIHRPDEEKFFFPDHHEPIVDNVTFEAAGKIREGRRRRNLMGEFNSPLLGTATCAGCMTKMRYKRENINRKGRQAHETFVCRNQHKTAVHPCTPHRIREDVLQEIVLGELQELFAYVKEHREEFVTQIRKSRNKVIEQEMKAKTSELKRGEKRITELDSLIKKTFESNALGKLSDERFSALLADYETEQQNLKSRVTALEAEISAEQSSEKDLKQFLQSIDRCTEITELTTEIVSIFIDSVIVYEAVKKWKHGPTESQEVKIMWNCIGEWHVPTE
jgi:DNA invertase Pin-like site-specific DNA recombinase